jgi:hypothetical protein
MRAILSVALTPRFDLIASLLAASSTERPAVSRAQRRIAGVGVGMGQSLHPLRAFVKLSKVVLSKRPAGKAMPVAQWVGNYFSDRGIADHKPSAGQFHLWRYKPDADHRPSEDEIKEFTNKHPEMKKLIQRLTRCFQAPCRFAPN